MDIILFRTDSSHSDFLKLVNQLDLELENMNGESNEFFNQFNNIEKIKHVVIAYINGEAVGCGAFKPYIDETVEIKRMFVSINKRGLGTAKALLLALESWARELEYKEAILETGNPVAVKLYARCGYQVIPNYDQYIGIDSSICMKKNLHSPLLLKV